MDNIDGIITDEDDKCEEGTIYASSLGMFGDESDVSHIKSMSFNDLLHETSTEAKKFDKKDVEYVFIRNIKGVYKNPLSPTAFLDKGIKLVDSKVSKKDRSFFNHSTMSTSLKDGFVGLTLDGKEYTAKREFITQPEKVRYTSTCKPDKSKYTVYAIEVTKEERKNIEGMLNNAVSNARIKYDVITNLLIGIKLIKNDIFGNKKQSTEAKRFDENKFVCSTFVAYILAKCCPSIAAAYKNKTFDYDRLSPNQLINETPGKHKIFEGIWSEYNQELAKFLKKHPEMNKYNK